LESVSLMMMQFVVNRREAEIIRPRLLNIVLRNARQLVHAASKGRITTVQIVHIWTSHHGSKVTHEYRLEALRRISPIWTTLEPGIEIKIFIATWLEVADYRDKLKDFMVRYNKTPELALLAASQIDVCSQFIGMMNKKVWSRDWVT
jgi:hypothetical protein